MTRRKEICRVDMILIAKESWHEAFQRDCRPTKYVSRIEMGATKTVNIFLSQLIHQSVHRDGDRKRSGLNFNAHGQ